MTKVGVAILGANGYMARNALRALREARGRLAIEGVELELIALADPVYFKRDALEDARQTVGEYFSALNPCTLFYDADTALKFLTNTDFRVFPSAQTRPEDIVIYDATPTHDRTALISQVMQAERSRLFFLGEKPLLIDPIWLEKNKPIIDSLPLYCDFIETSNPIVNAIKKLIRDEALRITGIELWRTGCSGIKHVVGHDQRGVQGGAILDKAVHDISITIMLLNIAKIAGFEVTDARIHELIPNMVNGRLHLMNSRCEFQTEEDTTFEYKSKEGSRMLLPADGQSSFAIEWILHNGDRVTAKYLVGWLGYLGAERDGIQDPAEAHFVQRLGEYGYDASSWLLRETFKSPSGMACVETQARIAIIDVEDCDKNRSSIVANFIASAGDDHRPIYRWANRHSIDHGVATKKSIREGDERVYSDQKRSDLADVFYRVICDCLQIRETKYLGSHACVLVHDAMLRARDMALDRAAVDFASRSFDFEKIERYIARRITPSK